MNKFATQTPGKKEGAISMRFSTYLKMPENSIGHI